MTKIHFLGTGTSCGIPMIGCKCPVCSSENPKNKRLRTSLWIETDLANLIIDTGPDFRQQALENQIPSVDAVLYTHNHADHLNGLDDLRSYNHLQKSPIPLYGNKETIHTIEQNFAYCFAPKQIGGGVPLLRLNTIRPFTRFSLKGLQIVGLPVMHGSLEILGYLFDQFAYITDASYIADTVIKQLAGIKTLVINTLRPRPHSTHFCLEESIEMVQRIRPERAYFIHLSHQLEHEKTQKLLPKGIFIAYDGLTVDI